MIGQTISHYKIIEKLGEGGMGVVYKAQDTRLNRLVALKFLRADLLHDSEAVDRFVNEAQAASSLDHANICTIYEIDKATDGRLFICMAYYDGETLRKQVGSGQLSVDRAIDIATQVAQGLQRAHEAGIVHRDIKPENIIITKRSEVKIVDFGLAKLAKRTQLTKTGTTLGTLAYMSPEQIQAKPVDHRTDIWSLGVVLFEMLAGRLPFRGDYDAAMIYSIVHEEPEALADSQNRIPLEFETVVRNCLEKQGSDRYQNANELLANLHQLQEKLEPPGLPFRRIARHRITRKPLRHLVPLGIVWLATLSTIAGYFFFGKSVETADRIPIAVIDFVNETKEEELDGLSGMFITALQQSRHLDVMTRSRMFDILKQIGGADSDRIDEVLGREICQRARVKAMIIADIHKFGRFYTIDLKVLDPESDEYLFATREEGEGHESIIAMIDKLAAKTRTGLREENDEIQNTRQRVAEVTTTNLKAYQHYFQGEQFINKLKFKEAKEELEKAIALDSTFGLPYYRLSYIGFWWNNEPIDDAYMIQKAMTLIDRIPEKDRYLVRAEYNRVYGGGWPAAISVLEEMEKRYPDDKEMMFILGDGAYHTGDYPRALKYLKDVLAIDPTHERALQHLVRTFRDRGNFEQMIEAAEKYVAVTASPEAYAMLASSYAAVGEYGQGIEKIKHVRELFPQENEFASIIANLYMHQRKYDLAEQELLPLIEKGQPIRAIHVGFGGLRDLYTLTGQYRLALDICDKQIALYWHQKDTTSAAATHIRKALLILDGWNDIEQAWKEVEKTFAFRSNILPGLYISNLFDLYVYHGDYFIADSLLRVGAVTVNSNRAFFHSVQGECDEAENYALEVLSAAEPWRKLFVLYPLAKCKFEAGEFNQALHYLLEFKKFDFSFRGIRARYYSKCLYLLGRIYEELGQLRLAIQNYQELIEIWKDADHDLPELIDARARLAILNRMM